MKLKLSLVAAALGLTFVGSARLARATSYDANAEFSTANTGTWTYGDYSKGALDPADFVAFGHDRDLSVAFPAAFPPGIVEWYNGDPSTDPNVIYNTTSADFTDSPSFGSVDFPSHTLTLGPAGGPTVVRFTAPKASYYDVSAIFETVQVPNAAPVASVFVRNAQLYSSQLTDTNSPFQFGQPSTPPANLPHIYLAAGDNIDFVVSGGTKTTALLEATVIPVPLPASVGVGFGMLAGFGALFAVRKRLRRTPRIAV